MIGGLDGLAHKKERASCLVGIRLGWGIWKKKKKKRKKKRSDRWKIRRWWCQINRTRFRSFSFSSHRHSETKKHRQNTLSVLNLGRKGKKWEILLLNLKCVHLERTHARSLALCVEEATPILSFPVSPNPNPNTNPYPCLCYRLSFRTPNPNPNIEKYKQHILILIC